jgi:hypothetical protein
MGEAAYVERLIGTHWSAFAFNSGEKRVVGRHGRSERLGIMGPHDNAWFLKHMHMISMDFVTLVMNNSNTFNATALGRRLETRDLE